MVSARQSGASVADTIRAANCFGLPAPQGMPERSVLLGQPSELLGGLWQVRTYIAGLSPETIGYHRPPWRSLLVEA